MKKQTFPLKNALILLLTAAIWGVAFVAQSEGNVIGPFTFNSTRSFIGSIFLVPVILLLDHMHLSAQPQTQDLKTLLLGGISCGVILCLASNFQQIGIQYTSVGKAGFLTACYIVLVPVLGLFRKKKCSPFLWAAVLLALFGLYLLCMTDSFSLGKGDILLLISAVLFSFHILVIDYFSPKVNGVKMSCIQFLVCGILTAVPAFLLENPDPSGFGNAWIPVLYAGVLSCGVAYTLQIIGQKNVNPTIASLILSLESCISVLAGWVLLGERLSAREISGCVIMFAAIIIAQLPQKQA